jgi:hypothetical protein
MKTNRLQIATLLVLMCHAGIARAADGKSNDAQEAVLKLDKVAQEIAADMTPVGEPITGYLNPRSSTTLEVQLDRARCYKFVAVGAASGTELSLAVKAHGKEVASKRTANDDLVANWCSPGRVKAKIKLTLFSGGGHFAVGVYGENVGTAKQAPAVGGAGVDFVSNRVRQLYGQYGKKRLPKSDVLKGNLTTAKEQTIKIRLEADHCYTVIAAGSPSVRNLDLVLVDPDGRELLRDTTRTSFPVLHTDPCIRATGDYALKVKMFSGYGQFGLQLFSD